MVLPSGPGTPRTDALPLFESATAACRAVRTLTAELTLSGRTGQQKIRGHVLAGLAPGALRLEGVAPFGAPAFILAAENGRGTLLLARDRRVLQSAPPAEILQALVGVSLSPDDLLKGQATLLHADAQHITLGDVIPDEDGVVVLSLHWQAGLRAAPGRVQVEREPDGHDPIGFVRLRTDSPAARVTLTWEHR